MKYYKLVLLICMLWSKISFSQCSIKTQLSDAGKYKLSMLELENIYLNKDLENGVFKIDFSLSIKVSITNPSQKYYYIQITVMTSRSFLSLIPRTIVLNDFEIINAEVKLPSYISENGLNVESCVFRLSESEFDYLKKNQINKIYLIDKIADRGYEFMSNPRLISNQVDCINKIITEN